MNVKDILRQPEPAALYEKIKAPAIEAGLSDDEGLADQDEILADTRVIGRLIKEL